ncbi:MAG: hypothetical protein VKK42_27370 [Lyngbya sp.]|nr:hypothetical protein [Lyngbya sp.]
MPKSIPSILPAELANQYLAPDQFVRIIHAESQTVYGWCNVEDLLETLAGNNIKNFLVISLDLDNGEN